MCTGFIKKTDTDLFCAFNMDLPDGAWDYQVYTEPDAFYIGMRTDPSGMGVLAAEVDRLSSILSPDGINRAHGVHASGNFCCNPYMNEFDKGRWMPGLTPYPLLTDQFLRGKLTLKELMQKHQEEPLTNLPGYSMHALMSDSSGNLRLLEPGIGIVPLDASEAVLTNYSLLAPHSDIDDPNRELFYGKARRQLVQSALREEKPWDAVSCMEVLAAASMDAPWPTRVSFVYSLRENAVLYALERKYDRLLRHTLLVCHDEDGENG